MRVKTTERSLFGQRSIAIWASDPIFARFEKEDAKVQVKIIEFDYGNQDEHVLIEIGTNGPDCPGITRGVNIFKHNEITSTLLKYMKKDKRDLQRLLMPHRSSDAILYSLTKSLQSFTYGI